MLEGRQTRTPTHMYTDVYVYNHAAGLSRARDIEAGVRKLLHMQDLPVRNGLQLQI